MEREKGVHMRQMNPLKYPTPVAYCTIYTTLLQKRFTYSTLEYIYFVTGHVCVTLYNLVSPWLYMHSVKVEQACMGFTLAWREVTKHCLSLKSGWTDQHTLDLEVAIKRRQAYITVSGWAAGRCCMEKPPQRILQRTCTGVEA